MHGAKDQSLVLRTRLGRQFVVSEGFYYDLEGGGGLGVVSNDVGWLLIWCGGGRKQVREGA